MSSDCQRCPRDGTEYARRDGIWRLLSPQRQAYFEQFVTEYQIVRHAEQRGSTDPEYYRSLPFVDLTRRFSRDWRIRARSYSALVERVLLPLEQPARALKILDLGSGNSWLSNRLAQRGHDVAAVDLVVDATDGLGAYVHYAASFMPVQADFGQLPFTGSQIDVVIFNASLHYATSYEDTLAEALRVLCASGQLAILDSPVYTSEASGAQMVRERESAFQRAYGFPSNAIPSENYLTFRRLERLERSLGVEWSFIRPRYGLKWTLRPWRARLTGGREPARFMVIVGRRKPVAQDSSLSRG
jgi:SAM-dependent methyltransferase